MEKFIKKSWPILKENIDDRITIFYPDDELKRSDDIHWHKNCYYLVHSPDKSNVLDIAYGYDCHGELEYVDYNEDSIVQTAFNFKLYEYQKRKWNLLTDAMVLKYYDWAANRSPFKEGFITKDADELFINGAIHDMNVPGNLLFAALHLFRHVWEQTGTIGVYLWNVLVDSGVPENLAYLYAHRIKASKHVAVYVRPLHSDDSVHLNLMTTEDIKDFCEGRLNQLKFTPSFIEEPVIKGVFTLTASGVTGDEDSFYNKLSGIVHTFKSMEDFVTYVQEDSKSWM